MHICILGGGIVGFNTALQLQQQWPNATLTMIATVFDESTTSYRAAGIFRPGSNFCGSSPEIARKWIKDSYNYYDNLLHTAAAPQAGISLISGYLYASEHEFITRNSFLEGLVPIYRKATQEELELCPGNWKFGSFFTTLLIESKWFLKWAKNEFISRGGEILQREITTWEDLDDSVLNFGKKFNAVFNCTGLGSKWLCRDDGLVPVRGQVMKVKAPWIKMFFYGDYDTYVIPGQTHVTLGGCRQMDSYDTTVSKLDSQGIWERCTALVPSLKTGAVHEQLVGLRPYRHSVRCEMEEIGCLGTDTLKVIHNYGHGGYGVTSAPGTASYAVKLFETSLKSSNGSRLFVSNSVGKCGSKL